MSVMNFSEYIGGADDIKIETIFPSTQKSYVYNFGQAVTGWNFSLDYQTLVIDYLQFDRETGDPNFAKSGVAGFFPKGVIPQEFVEVVDASTGVVKITIPADLYPGKINADARNMVPITVVGVTWETAESPPQKQTHRWAFIQTWEPGVPIGDPSTESEFTGV